PRWSLNVSSTDHRTRLLWLTLAIPSFCFGLDLGNSGAARVRDRWGVEDGFPSGPVYAISQTKNGYLWIGSERGLVRFDGQRFRVIEHADPAKTVRPILGLTPDQDGDLWVRPRRPSLLRFRRGSYDAPMIDFKPSGSAVAAATRAADGSLLLWLL